MLVRASQQSLSLFQSVKTSREISLLRSRSQNIIERKSMCALNIQRLSEPTRRLNSLVLFTVCGSWQDKTPAVLTMKC